MPRALPAILISLLLFAPAASGQDEEKKEEKPPRAEKEAAGGDEEASPWKVRVHGDLLTRYILRIRESDSDQDIYESLRVRGDVGEDRRIRFLLHGLLATDIDGRAGNEFFADRGNTYGTNTHGYLYSAYAELKDVPRGVLERVRLGRQFIYLPETVHLDGATVQTARWRGLQALGQIGVPVHLYEGSPQGDIVAGAGLSYEPYRWLRLGAHYAHVEDEKFGIGDETNDFYALNGLARIAAHTRLGGRASWIDDQFRQVEGRLFSRWEAGGLSGGLRLTYQPETLREYATVYSPLYQVLLEYRPYYQVHLFAEKAITPNLDVEVGGMGRRLLDDDDEGTFNREFTRGYVALHAMDFPAEKLSTSLTGDLWLTDTDDIWSLGGDLTWRPAPKWRASTGYYFSMFKIDRVTLQEREKVQTVFVRAKGPIKGPLSFIASYEVEWDEGPAYHVVETAVRVGF